MNKLSAVAGAAVHYADVIAFPVKCPVVMHGDVENILQGKIQMKASCNMRRKKKILQPVEWIIPRQRLLLSDNQPDSLKP